MASHNKRILTEEDMLKVFLEDTSDCEEDFDDELQFDSDDSQADLELLPPSANQNYLPNEEGDLGEEIIRKCETENTLQKKKKLTLRNSSEKAQKENCIEHVRNAEQGAQILAFPGVATYCRNNVTPYKAEEGLSGMFSIETRDAVGYYSNISSKFSRSEIKELDSEGRAVITQHKFTVPGCQEERNLAVINVYCPRADPENKERLQMKLMFYDMLETRTQALLESGSHVMVVGDINTAHKPIDHCDPADLEQFNANPCRLWLNRIIWDPEKGSSRETKSEEAHFQLIDAFRYLHPLEENAFTCWSTQLNARVTNYGTRIDYILIDEGLKLRVEDCSILKDVIGSDHCPVRIVLNINGLYAPSLPSFSTKFYPEFSGTQKKLFDFYKKADASIRTMQHKEEYENNNSVSERKRKPAAAKTEAKRQKGIEQFFIKSRVLVENVYPSDNLVKFHGTESAASHCNREDCTIAENTMSTSSVTVLESDILDVNMPSTSSCTAALSEIEKVPTFKEENSQEPKSSRSTAAQSWKKMFTGPKPPPKCKGHNEPCVQRCVKKKGPNFNRKFWVCARGEGHSKDPLARCDFFLWDSQR